MQQSSPEQSVPHFSRTWLGLRRQPKLREPTLVFLSKGILLVTVLVIVYAAFLAHYRIGFDLQDIRCLPWKIWLTDTADHHASRGDYIAFRTDERVSQFFEPGSHFLKEVVGAPGDHVVITKGVVIVNGNPLAELNLAPKIDKPLSSFDRDFIVAKGHYFVMGTHPYSFDSRYWGTISTSQIIGKGRPIW